MYALCVFYFTSKTFFQFQFQFFIFPEKEIFVVIRFILLCVLIACALPSCGSKCCLRILL